ncbi:MAG: hypothetical protein IPM74_12160 [Crocinitomicaceae bacterium]|nr:hypothetical protein [Crocinitomicaceae bacterium]
MGRKIGSFGLVNYRRHPENPNYMVFGFNTVKEVGIFEAELLKTKTWYEKDTEETDTGLMYLFAVAESSMDEANRANAMVTRAMKVPMVKNNFLRYSVIIFVLLLAVFALIGYVKNKDKMPDKNDAERVDSTTFIGRDTL